VGEGAVWVANVEDETVSRIDPVTHERGRTIDVGDYASDLVVGAGTVWVALGALAELARINPQQDRAASPIPALGEGVPCGAPRASLAVGGGAVWFACEAADLGRVDVRTGVAAQVGLQAGILTSPSAVSPLFSDIVFGLESLWVVNRAANSVVEVDPATIQRQRDVTVGQGPTAIAAGSGSLWVTNFDGDTVTRIAVPGRGQTPVLDTFEVGDGPVDVAVGEGGVWVVSRLDRTLTRLDPETGDVEATIGLGNEPQRVAAGEGGVWVTVRAAEVEDG
jgi:streptogramin lyase